MMKKRFNNLKVLQKLVLSFLCATPLLAQAQNPENAPLLTNVMQLLKLTSAEAKARHPLQLRGVITYYDRGPMLFIQDATAGIYIWPGIGGASDLGKLDLHAGDIVEVKGVTGPGRYSPMVENPQFKVLGTGLMPEARKVSVGHLMTGQADAQWVETEGIVWSATTTAGTLALHLVDGANHIEVMLAPGGVATVPLLDSKLRVRGVCGVKFNERQQLTGVYLLSPGVSYIEIVGSPPEMESRSVQPINSLLRHSPESASGHRVRVQGAVTLQAGEKTIFIQDETGGLRVQLQASFKGQAGDQVEVMGFPQPGEYIPFLQRAVVTPIQRRARPVPLAADTKQIQSGQLNATLVRLQGKILDHERVGLEQALIVQAGQFVFKATLAAPSRQDLLRDFLNGSLVEVTGVCQSHLTGFGDRSFQLLLGSPADILVLAKPSWWNAQRLGWIVEIISLVSVAGLAWTIMVARAYGQLKKARAELRAAHGELEARVQSRTAELAGANASLQDEIAERKRVQAEIETIHKQLLDASRQAGMAEVATNVLHNVGNVLNSVNVSSSLVADNLKKSKASGLSKLAALLREHEGNLEAFIARDPKGKHLPNYISQLAEHLAGEQAAALEELALLQKNIEHIKDIVAMQQSYAKFSGVTETMKISDLMEDALRMNAGALTRHEVQVIREYAEVPLVTIDKHKVLQILVNLIRNAKYACDDSSRNDKRLTVRVTNGDNLVRVAVADNGVGIPAENLARIFNHGFTTRKDGHGFGLHSGALAAKELGGSLNVHSDGLSHGATFILELPVEKKPEGIICNA